MKNRNISTRAVKGDEARLGMGADKTKCKTIYAKAIRFTHTHASVFDSWIELTEANKLSSSFHMLECVRVQSQGAEETRWLN